MEDLWRHERGILAEASRDITRRSAQNVRKVTRRRDEIGGEFERGAAIHERNVSVGGRLSAGLIFRELSVVALRLGDEKAESTQEELRIMASTKEYRDYILEQLSLVPGITCRPMMGEFLLYADGVLFGGIYDDRLLVKKTDGNAEFDMSEALPYEGAKPMYLVDEVDDRERLKEIARVTIKGLR